MNPRVPEQGFDKDKIFGEEGRGLGRGRGPFLQKGASSPPRISPLEKKNKKAGGCLIAKK